MNSKSLNLNKMAALQLVLEFVPLQELLTSAMNGFALDKSERAQDNMDVCYKAITTFLK